MTAAMVETRRTQGENNSNVEREKSKGKRKRNNR